MPTQIESLSGEVEALKAQMIEVITAGEDGWEEKNNALKEEVASKSARIDALMEAKKIAVPEIESEPPAPPRKALPLNPEEAADKKSVNVNAGIGDNEDYTKYPFFFMAKGMAEFKLNNDMRTLKAFSEAHGINDMKALSSQNTPLGGWTLPKDVASSVIGMLRDALIFSRLGAQVWPVPNRTLQIPKQLTDGTAYWIGENTTLNTADFIGGAVELVLKQVGAGVVLPNNLLNTSVQARVNQLVQETLVAQIRLAQEYAYLFGVGAVPTGTNNTGAQPRGIVNTTGVKSFGVGADIDGTTNAAANGDAPTLTDFSRALGMIERLTNVDVGQGFAWVAHNGLRGTLREMADGVGRQYFVENVATDKGNTDMLYGYPIVYTNAVPTTLTVGTSDDCTYVIGGVWRHMIIGEGTNIAMDSSQQAGDAFWKNQTYVRAIADCDCNFEYPEAFVKMTGVRFAA
jgi:HK97 family phage major capsid protein